MKRETGRTETGDQMRRRWARALLRTLPGWRTVAPTTGTVTAVAYALKKFDQEMQALREFKREEEIDRQERLGRTRKRRRK